MSLLGFMFKSYCTFADKWRDRGLKLPSGVKVDKDIPYIAGGGKYNLMDINTPISFDAPLPVIVSVHGGGYVYATKKVYKFYTADLASRGFAVVNFNYHLAPRHKFPTQLTELNSVMNWLVENGEKCGFDLNNVFFVGDSAGAQIASHYAAVCNNKQFAEAFPFKVPGGFTLRAAAFNCGIYDFPKEKGALRNEHAAVGLDPSPFMRDYMGRDTERFGDMFNISGNITSGFPPTYIATSEYDFLKSQAGPFYELLINKGVTAKYKLYGAGNKKAGHVFHINLRLAEAAECNDDECAFFRYNMRV